MCYDDLKGTNSYYDVMRGATRCYGVVRGPNLYYDVL